MEADGLFTFRGTNSDELSFTKGDVIKVLDVESDKDWYQAELNGLEGVVPANYIKQKPNPWYYGKVTRVESEQILLKRQNGQYVQPDGAFLVRVSESSPTPGQFSLSVKWAGGVQHFKVLRDTQQGKYFLWVVKFNSLNELITYHRTSSVSRSQTIYLKDMVSKSEHNDCVQALFDFNAEEDGEISFRKGDVIMVLERPDANWWMGMLNTSGPRGLFPSTYVRRV